VKEDEKNEEKNEEKKPKKEGQIHNHAAQLKADVDGSQNLFSTTN